ncbi:hypothetical protein [Actinoallomurus soli]|uniref:hypothetical protein n=1 Tax=Actinoallomurus soli TaxID=2952535 RepID=UPI0020929A9A|nr:hypothetical protein [Actinoallomurus soli]MCO5968165.1 hypothetical protein [Actinoallomurus soli]
MMHFWRIPAVTHFVQATGWLALLVFALPALGYLLVMLLARPRPPAIFAAPCVFFVVAWFLAALPVMAPLWVMPPLARAAVAAAIAYLVALVVPLASGMARYPLHVIRCGRLPVVGTTFAAAYSYTVPASPEYMVSPFNDHFFCSCEEASAAGFHKFP